MCGIIAYISPQQLQVTHPALTSIDHRGPDDGGIQHFKFDQHHLTLAHKRLSIIDLSKAASQPMQSGSTWIIFNGEIYNYQELRIELKNLGFHFRTASDTEVILAAYHHWGKKCLEHLNGMFAFVIWDNEKQTLFAARDRFGIKPIYYWNTSQGFALVSELKQLSHLPHFQAALNIQAAYQFLVYADFSYNQETLWKNVLELEPGHFIYLNAKTWVPGSPVFPQKWYHLPVVEKPQEILEADAINTFQNLFEKSIRLHMRADVSVGTALSGGLDSSAITHVIDKIIRPQKPYHTFSATYEESEGDESPYIKAMLKTISGQSHTVHVKAQEAADQISKAVFMHDLPILGRAVLPYYNLCQFIQKRGIKVVLQGQGADEILGGYIEFHRAYLSELILGRRYWQAFQTYKNYRQEQKTGTWRSDLKKIFTIATSHTKHHVNSESHFAFFNTQFIQAQPTLTQYNTRLQRNVGETHRTRFIAMRMLLHNVDRASMANSLEVRVPFLDHRLVEFCLNLPSHLKIQKGTSKYLLRQAMQSSLPQQIMNRTVKMGFSSPEATWAKTHLREFYLSALRELHNHPIINSKTVEKQFQSFLNGTSPYDRIFWRIVAFGHWQKTFGITS